MEPSPRAASSGRQVALAILNGVVGDHLHATSNALAIEMRVVRGVPARRVAVFVHGLMCTEDVWRLPDGTDYGALLERDFGIAPLYMRFNTGRSVADSGEAFARLLDELTARHPVIEEILSGRLQHGRPRPPQRHARRGRGAAPLALARDPGLLHRDAAPRLALGAPGPRVVRILRGFRDPYTDLVAELGDLRSSGIRDLGDSAHPIPLLPAIRHHFVAGFVAPWMATILGDALVPLASGTNGAISDAETAPPHHVKIMPGVAHMTLAHHPDVYAHLRAWCEAA